MKILGVYPVKEAHSVGSQICSDSEIINKWHATKFYYGRTFSLKKPCKDHV
jgi:hypothetical protein